MRRLSLLAAIVAITSCTRAETAFDPQAIVALERGALDRWGKGDPQGFLEIYAPEITYFDPFQEQRIDGRDAMKALIEPLTGRINVPSYEMIGPKVQRHGDAAVLSYNLHSHARLPNGDSMVVRWNSTAVYAQIAGQWKSVHSHWSFIKPNIPGPPAQ
jgi:ketosteroid isomerase-like protein